MSNLLGRTKRDKIQNMSSLIRYNNIFHVKSENVAEHSFYVTLYANEICNFFNIPNNEKLIILEKALTHDVHEIELSDIPHNVKENIKFLNNICLEYEEDFNNKNFKEIILKYNKLTPEQKIIVDNIVLLADIMDVYYYANNEIKFGNIDFMEIKYKAQDRINECLDNLKIFFTEEQINDFNKLIKIH